MLSRYCFTGGSFRGLDAHTNGTRPDRQRFYERLGIFAVVRGAVAGPLAGRLLAEIDIP